MKDLLSNLKQSPAAAFGDSLWLDRPSGETITSLWNAVPLETRIVLAYEFCEGWPSSHYFKADFFAMAKTSGAGDVYRPFLRFLTLTLALTVDGPNKPLDLIECGKKILREYGPKKFVHTGALWPQ